MILPKGRFVSVLNGSFQVICYPRSGKRITSVEWLVNGRPLESLNLNGRTSFSTNVGGLGTLIFNNLQSDHNNSVIKCIATTSEAEILSSVNSSKLIIQGEQF